MHIVDFDYELPAELIAQTPLEERDASRMLVLDRREQAWTDSGFKELTKYLRPNDVVVVNNSRVIPARLLGRREGSGGQVEIFLVREIEPEVWEALVRPGGRLKKGARADLTLIDLDIKWTLDPKQFNSKSLNSPFDEWPTQGRAIRTIVGGDTVFWLG